MRYEILETKPYLLGIDLEQPFPLGFGTLEKLPRVLFVIKALDESGTIEGIGEASIDFPFSKYDAWDVYWALSQLELGGRNIEERKNILTDKTMRKAFLEQFPAAFTALNMALDDLYGKAAKLSVLDIYGQERKWGKAIASISFKEDTALLIKEINEKWEVGFVPKPKVGRGLEADIETITAVDRHAERNDINYVLDFNGQYELDEFRQLVKALLDKQVNFSRILFLEQPTSPKSGIEVLTAVKAYLLKKGIETPIIADESFVTLEDAKSCVENGIALNFKIHKIGGLFYAREIEASLLEKMPGGNIVGGTFPTAIGRAYDQQAAAVLRSTDLPGDGWEPSTNWFKGRKHLIKEDFPLDKSRKRFLPIKGPGLGINPDWRKINQFIISNPQLEYNRVRQGLVGEKIEISLRGKKKYPEVYKEVSGRNPDWNL